MMSNILEYRNVDIHYGKKQVIENVSLSMKPGEILGIVGELSLIHISEPTRH